MMLQRAVAWRQHVALLLIALTCYAYFLPRWADWNQNSRFDLIVALVDDHTLQIDSYVANTGDYALYDGHYYSDKAPGMAALGMPVYAAFRHLLPQSIAAGLDSSARGSSALSATLSPNGTGIQTDKVRFFLGLVVTTFVVGALPAAAFVLIFFGLVGRLGGSLPEQWLATLLYAFATPAFAYANSLVGHQTSAALLFTAFAMLFGIQQARLGRHWLLVVGFLLSTALVTEFPTGLIVGLLGLYAVAALHGRLGVILRLVLGSVPSLIVLVVHDLAAFGTPLPVGYLHSALWSDVHQIGFLSLTYPHPDAMWGITFGVYRGLFFLAPYLLLAIPGYRVLWERGWRLEFAVLLAVPLVYFLYNASSAMWQGGFAVGPRYVVASLPFLALPAGAGLARVWRTAQLRPIAGLAIAWSFLAIWTETIGGQALPDYSPNPLFDFSLPKLVAGDVARNIGMITGLASWMSLLPLVLILLLGAGIAVAPLPRRVRKALTDTTTLRKEVAWRAWR
jgi:hypothetical protein